MIWKLVIKHFKSRPATTFFTVIAMAIALSILGSTWTLSENLEKLRTSNKTNDHSLTVYLDSKKNLNSQKQLIKKISNFPFVEKTELSDSRQTLETLQSEYGETLTGMLTEKNIPIALKVFLIEDKLSVTKLNTMLSQIKKTPGIIDIDDGNLELNNSVFADEKTSPLRWSKILLIIVFLVVALLVSHLVRLAFESSKKEIETFKLIGAPKYWIFMPLLIEGLLLGLASALLSIAFMNLIIAEVLPKLTQVFSPDSFKIYQLSVKSTGLMVALALFASTLGALFSWPLVSKETTLK